MKDKVVQRTTKNDVLYAYATKTYILDRFSFTLFIRYLTGIFAKVLQSYFALLRAKSKNNKNLPEAHYRNLSLQLI